MRENRIRRKVLKTIIETWVHGKEWHSADHVSYFPLPSIFSSAKGSFKSESGERMTNCRSTHVSHLPFFFFSYFPFSPFSHNLREALNPWVGKKWQMADQHVSHLPFFFPSLITKGRDVSHRRIRLTLILVLQQHLFRGINHVFPQSWQWLTAVQCAWPVWASARMLCPKSDWHSWHERWKGWRGWRRGRGVGGRCVSAEVTHDTKGSVNKDRYAEITTQHNIPNSGVIYAWGNK